MIWRGLFAGSAWLMMSAVAPAAEIDCPTSGYDKVGNLLTAAPSCDASMKLLLACQLGSSGDVALAEIVIKKCEAMFLSTLSKTARRAYDRKVGACGRELANESGTLYQSIRAICAAEAAHTYAARAGKNPKP